MNTDKASKKDELPRAKIMEYSKYYRVYPFIMKNLCGLRVCGIFFSSPQQYKGLEGKELR
jgi:hypothetical protein